MGVPNPSRIPLLFESVFCRHRDPSRFGGLVGLFFLILIGLNIRADTAVPAWIRRYNSSLGAYATASFIRTTSSGDVIVGGTKSDNLNGITIVLIKYSSSGLPLWTNFYASGSYPTEINQLRVDASDNVFVVGDTQIGNSLDFLEIKYSSAGLPLWTNYFDAPNHSSDRGWDAVVSPNGDLIVTGYTFSNYYNIASIKYTADGNPVWTNYFDGPAGRDDSPNRIVQDQAGNIIIGGSAGLPFGASGALLIKYTSSGIPLWTNYNFGASGVFDMAVDKQASIVVAAGDAYFYSIIKLTSDGTPVWTNVFQHPHDEGPSIGITASDSIVVSGFVTNSISGGFNPLLLELAENGNLVWSNLCDGARFALASDGTIFMCAGPGFWASAYSSLGVPLWTNYFSSNESWGYNLTLTPDNKVIVTGRETTATVSGRIITIAYEQNGTPVWTNIYADANANNSDYSRTLALAKDGSVIVSGDTTRLVGEGSDFTTIKYSPSGLPLWTNWYGGDGHSSDSPVAAVVDGNDDIIITGQAGSSNDFEVGFATVKYSADGLPLWTNLYQATPNLAGPVAVRVDSENNVFVAGYAHGGPSFYDYVLAKYSVTGVPQWTNRYTSAGNWEDRVTGLAILSTGTAVITGFAHGNPFAAGNDFVTIAYSSGGSALWTNAYHLGLTDNRPVAISRDSLDNVYVTGAAKFTNETTYHFTTIKYSSSGLGMWTNRFLSTSTSEDRPVSMAVDSSGNVFVTGYSSNSTTAPDIVTLKYTTAGTAVWTNRFDGTGHSDDRPTAVAVTKSGDVVISGVSRHGSTLLTADILTLKYSNAGSLLWSTTYNGPVDGDDHPINQTCLAVGMDDAIYVTGVSDSNLLKLRGYDFVTIKYVEVAPINLNFAKSTNGLISISFTNRPGTTYTVLTSTNVESINWELLGVATETTPGQFNFTTNQDPAVRRFYRVSSP